MSVTEDGKGHLRCNHCGRLLTETSHTRSSYRVDYYTLYTGDVEPVTLQRSDDPAETVTVLRLIRPTRINTCVDCYRRNAIRQEREALFRTELPASGASS